MTLARMLVKAAKRGGVKPIPKPKDVITGDDLGGDTPVKPTGPCASC